MKEQTRKPGNKPSHIGSHHSWQGCRDHSIGKRKFFQQIVLGNWISTSKRTELDSCCSVAKSDCLTLCDPMNCSTPGFSVLHYLSEFAQTHVNCVSDAIQLSDPLSLPSPLALNFSQHQDLFQWISSSHLVAKVLELQLQQQSFQ